MAVRGRCRRSQRRCLGLGRAHCVSELLLDLRSSAIARWLERRPCGGRLLPEELERGTAEEVKGEEAVERVRRPVHLEDRWRVLAELLCQNEREQRQEDGQREECLKGRDRLHAQKQQHMVRREHQRACAADAGLGGERAAGPEAAAPRVRRR